MSSTVSGCQIERLEQVEGGVQLWTVQLAKRQLGQRDVWSDPEWAGAGASHLQARARIRMRELVEAATVAPESLPEALHTASPKRHLDFDSGQVGYQMPRK